MSSVAWTRVAVLMGLVLVLTVGACEQAGEGVGGSEQGFALTACDADSACEPGFECAVFPCASDCDPDASDCDACHGGTICLPRPTDECLPEQCPAGTVCERSCSGGCDWNTGYCYDVDCRVTCVPVGVPTPPQDGEACVTDFTDACLPPGYPVAARLDDVCAAQGLVLTDVSVAAECWPGAVQFQWTCCRADGPRPEPCQMYCDDAGTCREHCCDDAGTCCERSFDATGAYYERCCDVYGQCWGTDPGQPACYEQCDANGACGTWCCDAATGACWPTTEPGRPECWTECDAAGFCRETCCDPTTGECWSNEQPGDPTQVCVEGGYDCVPPDVDPKMRAWEECAAQGLELASFEIAFECGDGLFAYKWTCCGPHVEPPLQCWTECTDDGQCYETCCDAYSCWPRDPGTPSEPQCWKECKEDGTCIETCCDPTGACWSTDPNAPAQCWTECRDDGTCVETCCDAAGNCWSTGDPQPPTEPGACVPRDTGIEGACSDLETLLAFASWDCAALGLELADHAPWGDCNGAFQGLRYTCCAPNP